jgi:AhpD family alkylhydroperoxidase
MFESMEGGFNGSTFQLCHGGSRSIQGYARFGAVSSRICGLEESLINLIYLRASQINGCAYCLDMHWKELRAIGENEHRLHALDAWPQSPFYTDRERAALEWTEALTLITEGHVPDEVYEEVRQHFNDKELSDLTLAVVSINGWNRLNIAARTVPGAYQPVKRHSRTDRLDVGVGAFCGKGHETHRQNRFDHRRDERNRVRVSRSISSTREHRNYHGAGRRVVEAFPCCLSPKLPGIIEVELGQTLLPKSDYGPGMALVEAGRVLATLAPSRPCF